MQQIVSVPSLWTIGTSVEDDMTTTTERVSRDCGLATSGRDYITGVGRFESLIDKKWYCDLGQLAKMIKDVSHNYLAKRSNYLITYQLLC